MRRAQWKHASKKRVRQRAGSADQADLTRRCSAAERRRGDKAAVAAIEISSRMPSAPVGLRLGAARRLDDFGISEIMADGSVLKAVFPVFRNKTRTHVDRGRVLSSNRHKLSGSKGSEGVTGAIATVAMVPLG